LQYKYPEDKQDCIAVAIMDCFLYWRNYNPEKSSNAFAYISQIVKMGMCKSFRKIYGKFPLSKRVSVNHSKIYTI
jgi:DNA-directed RNA polymerase specialized sigma subunit